MAFRHTRIALALSGLGERVLPDWLYIWTMQRVLPLVNKNRRWPTCRVAKDASGVYRAEDESGGRLFFYEPTRIGMYLWPNGLETRMGRIRDKYQRGPVVVSAGDIVVDVGANIGEFGISVSGRAERVLAFEPDPTAFRCLEANATVYTKVTAINRLLADRPRAVTFHTCAKTADSSIIEPDSPHEKVEMEATTLDAALAELGIDQVDFLKIEAEGAEPEILVGAERTLERVGKLAVDAGPERRGEPTVEPVAKMLRELGFDVETTDEMVYASRPQGKA